MSDWAQVYADNAEAIAKVAPSWDAAALATVVPATPEWTVYDVLRHLAGGSSDVLAGRMDGAPSPDWTNRHVAERTDRSVADLLEELRGNVAPIGQSVADNPTPAMVWDIATHHADLHEALGLGRPPERMWRPVLDALAARFFEDPSAVTAEPYELFRILTSRRSRRQVTEASRGTVDPEKVGIFGPRDDDQPQP